MRVECLFSAVCFNLQLYREQLREDHNDNMLTILNEFGDLKKKRSFLLRNPVFNGISILKSLKNPFYPFKHVGQFKMLNLILFMMF